MVPTVSFTTATKFKSNSCGTEGDYYRKSKQKWEKQTKVNAGTAVDRARVGLWSLPDLKMQCTPSAGVQGLHSTCVCKVTFLIQHLTLAIFALMANPLEAIACFFFYML